MFTNPRRSRALIGYFVPGAPHTSSGRLMFPTCEPARENLFVGGQSEAAQDPHIVTQREIGQIIGMSRESTNKQLRIWEEKKWVRLNRGGVAVLDPHSLAEIAAAERDQS